MARGFIPAGAQSAPKTRARDASDRLRRTALPPPQLNRQTFKRTAYPCGSEPARDELNAVPSENHPLHPPKSLLLQPPPTPHHQATHPCAFAYNYARIRPLVRLVPGLYRFLATAHQWSGLVARLRIRSHESHQSGIARTRWWLCAWRLRARRVFRFPTGLLTCAQLPPFRLVARR